MRSSSHLVVSVLGLLALAQACSPPVNTADASDAADAPIVDVHRDGSSDTADIAVIDATDSGADLVEDVSADDATGDVADVSTVDAFDGAATDASDAALDAGTVDVTDAADDLVETDAIDGAAADVLETDAIDGAADDATDAAADDVSADTADAAAASGTIVLVAGSSANLFVADYREATGTWTASTLARAVTAQPAVTLTSDTTAVAVIRGSSGSLDFTTWTSGTWAAPSAIAPGITTRAAPSITTVGTAANVVFHGDDFRHYFASYGGASWSPVAEAVGGGASASFGPSPAAVTELANTTVVAFAGNDHDLYDQTRSGGWGIARGHGLGSVVQITPTIAALSAGPSDLVVAFVRTSDARIVFTTRTSGSWSAPAPIDTNAFTNEPVSLVAMRDGGAVLAYRGQDNGLYFSRYAPSATPPWTAPAPVVPGAVSIASPPALAPGVGGHDAEIAYVVSGVVQHARLTGTSWSAPVTVGGTGQQFVAIASR